ncbi:helix-turn-helix transcriptional regulator [Halalkalicoccus jeotgali]|uniref:helix-turn-helix transcriptional regulator n=1 Tax=Halalkalicoccus jeotgali TaxID=413810 RepID=UPI001F4CE58F|nr:sigma-70 family RNA polymerase sigma factor [Halalkalicoccus jeotgali]
MDELPLYLPEQNAVLVGRIIDDESEMAGMAAYYVHWRGGVYIGNYNEADNAFTSHYSTKLEERMMSHQVKAFDDMEVEKELSSIGEALLDAYDFAETQAMADKQAHVFALQSMNGFTRSQTANILNVSPSTVDSQRASATKKADAAVAFTATYTEKKENPDNEDLLKH